MNQSSHIHIIRPQIPLFNSPLPHSPKTPVSEYTDRMGCRAPKQILDVGCSVGMSTDGLIRAYPEGEFTGLDLSPHFLAVARYGVERAERKELMGFIVVSFFLLSCICSVSFLPDA